VTAFLIVAATFAPSLLFVALAVWRDHHRPPAAPDRRPGTNDQLLATCQRIADAEQPRKETP
jgi:hypothetical protein